ncbi:MAG: hypothetical protein NW217_06815 [Hyphomicrobiaceae bacterium]|nr:hypothetical protein [Hyphomicrobiaceae bacterium]
MRGEITKFNETLAVGVIKTEDGRRFRFTRDAVVNLNGRLEGYEVDFVSSRNGPSEIILLTGTPWQVFAGRKTN